MIVSQPITTNQIAPSVPERRQKPRLECVCSAIVRGTDTRGAKFEARATTTNLSANGVYLRMDRWVEPGRALFVLVRFPTMPREESAGPAIAIRGVVVRSEPAANGTYGLALRFERRREL